MISQETINTIFSTARVEEVIGDFVQLKKSGSNYKGLSPFTDEKTPSFMVSPAKQIWKDFSSGKGGNVVSFLMELESYTYPEALRYLAQKYNIEIKEDKVAYSEEDKAEKEHKEQLYKILELANTFYQDQLHTTEEGKNIGLSYFHERGFNGATIKEFQLGYSPIQKDAFTAFALKKGYTKELLEQAGLSIFKENYEADRFRERIMFPIFSYSGRVLGFGGRILGKSDKKAKYINSPESDVYHKSKILFGLFQAKKEIIKTDSCLLVEGYTDVISLYQNEIKNVVASSGTALTIDQIRLIKRLSNNITLLYDGDTAGIKASLRGIDLILEQNMNVRVVLFPDGEDPDSFAQKHSKEELQEFFSSNAKDFIHFKTDLLLNETANDPAKKTEVIRDILNSISLVSNHIQREIYIQNVSKTLDISEQSLFKDLQQILASKRRESSKEQRQQEKQWVVHTQNIEEIDPIFVKENKLMEIMLKFGDFVMQIPNGEEVLEITVIEEIIHQLEEDDLEFKTEFFQNLFNEIKEGYGNDELRKGDYFIQNPDEVIHTYVANTLMDTHELSPNWKGKNVFIKPYEKDIKKEVKETILSYKLLSIEEQIHSLGKQNFEDEQQRQEMLQKTMQLIEIRARINAHLNRII